MYDTEQGQSAEELNKQLLMLMASRAALEEFRRKTAVELHQVIQERAKIRGFGGDGPLPGSMLTLQG